MLLYLLNTILLFLDICVDSLFRRSPELWWWLPHLVYHYIQYRSVNFPVLIIAIFILFLVALLW